MIGSSRLLVSPTLTIALTVVILAVAIILFVANVAIASAQQQQQQPLTNQPAVTQRAELFQSTEDGIRLNVPQGWVIQDLNNTGPISSEELRRGYGILARLCLSDEEQQRQRQQGQGGAAPGNASNNNSCQGAQEEVIHVVRYPNLDSGIQMANNASTGGSSATPTTGASFNNNNSTIATTIDNILVYHLQKLRQVGYNSIQIVNNADMTVNLAVAQSNQTLTTLPAKFVEITYTTASAPDETRRGYFILTATNAIAPNLGTTKGYSVFYEGNHISAETRSSSSSTPTPLPQAVRQVFDSFELVTVAAATQTEPLTVEIISSDTEDTAPANFEFEAEITGGVEPYTIRWDFGDGSIEENDEEVEHTFDEAGSYSVDLTVTDSGDQSGSDSMEITVEEGPVEEEQTLEEEEEEEDNDLVDTDGIVDDFIDDLFGRLGLR
jgi:PKD repeat protein